MYAPAMKLVSAGVGLLVVVVACGKGDSKGGAGGSGAASGQPPAPTVTSGATGTITTTGALVGTWTYKPELALTCGWVPDNDTAALSITMSDGAGGAMALHGVHDGERTEVTFTSGKLDSPSPFRQTGGGVVFTGTGQTGGDAPVTVTARFDAVAVRGDETITIKGTVTGACN